MSDVENRFEFGIFCAFEQDGLVGIDPLAYKMGRFFCVLSVVLEEQVSVAMEDAWFHGVKYFQFTNCLFFEKSGSVCIVDSMPVLIPLGPEGEPIFQNRGRDSLSPGVATAALDLFPACIEIRLLMKGPLEGESAQEELVPSDFVLL